MSLFCEQHAVGIPFPATALRIGVLVICKENWFDSPEGRSVHFTVQIMPSRHGLGNGMTGAASWRTSSSLTPGLFGYLQLWGCQAGLTDDVSPANTCYLQIFLRSSFLLLSCSDSVENLISLN